MKHAIISMLALLLIPSAGVFAQKAKEDGKTVELINHGVMMQGKDVKGYYFFYKMDKADKDNYNYLVNIYDNNFNDASTFELKKPKYFRLMEAAYNGDAFMFQFLDTKKRTENMITYTEAGKLIKDMSAAEMDPAEYAAAVQANYTSTKPNENVNINAVPGKGFIKFDITNDKKEKKRGYAVSLYSNDLKKQWSVTPAANEKHKFESFEPIYYDYKFVMGLIMSRDAALSGDFGYDLAVINVETGKKMFQTSLKDSRYTITPTGAFYDSLNKQFVVMGEYIDGQEKLGKGRSNGIAALAFDQTGKATTKKYLTWTKDLNKFLPVDAKGKLEDGGYLGFQKIFATSEGKIFAIAEQYKKDASGAGIAMAVLSMGRSVGQQAVVNVKIMDLMVLEFNKDFSIAKVSSFDKEDHHEELPGTLAYFPFNVVCVAMRYMGMFDYNFLTPSEDGKTFSICYDIAKKKASDPIKIGNLVYTPEGKFVQSPIEIKDDPTMHAIFPGKWGYLGVMEYTRKKKEIPKRLEKLDY